MFERGRPDTGPRKPLATLPASPTRWNTTQPAGGSTMPTSASPPEEPVLVFDRDEELFAYASFAHVTDHLDR